MFPVLESKITLITGFVPHKRRLRGGLDQGRAAGYWMAG